MSCDSTLSLGQRSTITFLRDELNKLHSLLTIIQSALLYDSEDDLSQQPANVISDFVLPMIRKIEQELEDL